MKREEIAPQVTYYTQKPVFLFQNKNIINFRNCFERGLFIVGRPSLALYVTKSILFLPVYWLTLIRFLFIKHISFKKQSSCSRIHALGYFQINWNKSRYSLLVVLHPCEKLEACNVPEGLTVAGAGEPTEEGDAVYRTLFWMWNMGKGGNTHGPNLNYALWI